MTRLAHVTGEHAVSIHRHGSLQGDPVGTSLAAALQAWCSNRDPRDLRRALVALLADLLD